MKKMGPTLAALLIGASTSVLATDTFDTNSNQLTVPAIQIGDTVYNNVVIQLKDFAVLSAGTSTVVAPSQLPACTMTNFNAQAYDTISLGMTVDQVSQVVGCQVLQSVEAGQTTHGTTFMFWQIAPSDPTQVAKTYYAVSFSNGFVTQSSDGTFYKYHVGF
jgi:hypothetical protein